MQTQGLEGPKPLSLQPDAIPALVGAVARVAARTVAKVSQASFRPSGFGFLGGFLLERRTSWRKGRKSMTTWCAKRESSLSSARLVWVNYFLRRPFDH
jgi:hypothetical protein